MIGRPTDFFQYGTEPPPAGTDPEWDPELGFQIGVRWPCGCEFHGFHRSPHTFKKPCPAHPGGRPGAPDPQQYDSDRLVVVAIDEDESVLATLAEWPVYHGYEVSVWPPGTFGERAPVAIRRLVRVITRLESALARPRRYSSPEAIAESARKLTIARLALNLATARPRTPSRQRTQSA